MRVSSILNVLIHKRGLKIKRVAETLGVSRDTVCNWMKGFGPRDKMMFNKISSIFDLDSYNEANFKILLANCQKINNNDWGKFILGLMQKLSLTQTSLSYVLGFKSYSPSLAKWLGAVKLLKTNGLYVLS
jgi:transcriptional regulator with XRE-family HTH domain